MFIYLFWERQRQHKLGNGQRERETENPKYGLHNQHRARHGAQTHETVRSRPEPKPGVRHVRHLTDWATQVPHVLNCWFLLHFWRSHRMFWSFSDVKKSSVIFYQTLPYPVKACLGLWSLQRPASPLCLAPRTPPPAYSPFLLFLAPSGRKVVGRRGLLTWWVQMWPGISILDVRTQCNEESIRGMEKAESNI